MNDKFPISGFPSKEGLKLSITVEVTAKTAAHFGISIKRRIETPPWKQEVRCFSFPFRDFHQKKDWNSGVQLPRSITQSIPFRDFHQKKDWNLSHWKPICLLCVPISGFPSKEGLKPNSGRQQQRVKFSHFGISIKRRIETDLPYRQALTRFEPHFGISIKRRIETWALGTWTALNSTPISGFPSKEGLKQIWINQIPQIDGVPFRDFHQKKDWNWV